MRTYTYSIIVVAAALAMSATSALGHTVQICEQCNSNGSVTFYAASYHTTTRGPSPVGGIIVDGNTTDFTDFETSLPSKVTNCTDFDTRCSPPSSVTHWQTATVIGLLSGVHTVTTTNTSAVEEDCHDVFGGSFDDLTTDCESPVPTVSEWGMASVVLLLLAGLTIKFGALRFRKAA